MPALTTPCDSELQFHILSGEEYENARYGKYSKQGLCLLEAPWLLPVKVKYFMDRSPLIQSPDRRRFFMATRKSTVKANDGKREAVAVLEIDFQAGPETPTVGIKYISVLEDFRKNGLAMQLYGMLVEYLHASGERLYRTMPGQETPSEFTAAVTRLLDSQGIDWYNRETMYA